jgi:hypothetical protein
LGRVAEAKNEIDAAVAHEPDEHDGYAIGLDVALAEENFDDTVRFLMILEKVFGADWSDLEEAPEFAEFVKSPQYGEWLETHWEQD